MKRRLWSFQMILIIKVNEFELHDDEFVKPITDLLEDYKVVDYRDVNLEGVDKIIITGTALKDNKYLERDFSFLKDFKGKVLGICAGMQIIGKLFGYKLEKSKKRHQLCNKIWAESYKSESLDIGWVMP